MTTESTERQASATPIRNASQLLQNLTPFRERKTVPDAADTQGLEYALCLPGCRGPTGIDYGGMTFLRNNCPNGVEPTVGSDPDGDYLRLCVQKDAYRDATLGEPSARDRCELRDKKVLLGTAVQYEFELRVEDGFPIVDARMVLAQVKAPYYDADGGSPMFALRFERGRFLATIEHLYEAKDAQIEDGRERSRYLSPRGQSTPVGAALAFDHHLFGNAIDDDKELQVRALVATDGAPLPGFVDQDYRWTTTGVRLERHAPLPDRPREWNRFRLAIAPTRKKDCAGLIELHVQPCGGVERLVARVIGEFGHRGYDDPDRNTGPNPDQAYQYFKIGPYRDKVRLWGDAPAAIHVRHVRRSNWPDAAAFYDAEQIV